MPEYHYRCTAKRCKYEFETTHSIKQKPLETCPKCNKSSLERVIYGGCHISVSPGITTIGKQAEVNTKKMGRYGREEAERKRIEKVESSTISENMKEAIRQSGGKLHSKEDKSKKPWYWKKKDRSATIEKINKMTDEQKVRYVHTND